MVKRVGTWQDGFTIHWVVGKNDDMDFFFFAWGGGGGQRDWC